VKNEGACAADWAFSTTGLVEGVSFIGLGTLASLSEQELIDCTPTATCDEGSPVEASDYISMNDGIESEADYPYTATKGACEFSAARVVAHLGGISRIPPGDEQTLQAAVSQQGPVSVVLIGNWYDTYTTGIAGPDCKGVFAPEYRAALIVGYTESTSGTPYWIVKNSLGTAWGMEGYFYIVRGQNACGIANYAIEGQL
jgi:C1A family cysteine protease